MTLTFKVQQRVAPGEGAGDRVERALRQTGIHQGVRRLEQMLGIHCGCAKRREWLNRMLKS